MMPPRIDVTRAQIASVVAAFYAKARQHDVLGPVFAKHVHDWSTHEDKITCFWASAILHEKSFDGNPMIAHIQAGNVQTHHFAQWLSVFDDVLTASLPNVQSAQWSALAHRIGRGLSLGLEDANRPGSAVPRF